MTQLVRGFGNLQAKIMFVGEAPGDNEVRAGKPFVGAAGDMLDSMLAEAGIYREELYLDNVMPIRPPGNDFGCFYHDKRDRTQPRHCLLAGREMLHRTIKKLQPNLVVALGNEPLKALTDKSGIGNWRGSILWSNCAVKLLPTYHPANIMRAWGNRPLVVFDLKRAKEEGETFGFTEPEFNIHVVETASDALKWKDILLEDIDTPVSFDIETGGRQYQQLRCCGFGISPTEAVVFGVETSQQQTTLLQCIKDIVESDKPLIAQNAQYDITWLKHHSNIHPKNLFMDTMIAFHCVYAELPKKLAVLVSIFTKRPFFKYMRGAETSAELYHYNGLDCTTTLEVAADLEKEMKEFGVYDFYYAYSHPLIAPLIDTQLRGVKVDLARRDRHILEYTAKIALMQKTLNEFVGKPINVDSNKQMKELLYEHLGLPPQYHKKTKAVTADKKAIDKLAKKYDKPELQLAVQIRHYDDGLSKDLGIKKGDELDTSNLLNGRMHTAYNIAGTVEGRLASSRSLPMNSGTNLQNIPVELRDMYIPDAGLVFVSADLKQAEARVVAYCAEEPRLIELFERGENVFIGVGKWIFKEDIVKGTKRYTFCKNLIHGSHYGMGAKTFMEYASLSSQNEARELQGRYFTNFPNILTWQAGVRAELSKSRILINLLGRKRIFFDRWGDALFRSAYPFVPAGTVADVIDMAIVRLWKQGYMIMLQVHDELVVQVKPEDVEKAKADIVAALDVPLSVHGRTFVIPADISVGKNWKELK